MKEVTPDPDVLKSSVFHRLLQRAFPEWFPYDSIRFFHPFYTADKNAQFAGEQGYADSFKLTRQEAAGYFSRKQTYVYSPPEAQPMKPRKPIYLSKYAEVEALLAQDPKDVINPACLDVASLPKKVQEVLLPGQVKSSEASKDDVSPDNTQLTMAYFTGLMREIIEREIITVDGKKPIYQIDVTRE